jgi:hypothetical protein
VTNEVVAKAATAMTSSEASIRMLKRGSVKK